MSEDVVTIKLTAATVIDGQIQRAGTKVEMVEAEAKTLMRLGKAVFVAEAPAAPTSNAAQVAAAAAAAAVKPAPVAPAPAAVPAADPAAPAAK